MMPRPATAMVPAPIASVMSRFFNACSSVRWSLWTEGALRAIQPNPPRTGDFATKTPNSFRDPPTRLPAMADVAVEQGVLANWREVLRTGNPPRGRLDPVSRWLVLTRAAVLPMTVTAAAVAGLLAVGEHGFRPGLVFLAAVGIVLAHMANNLMNDLFDLEVGTDTKTYPRAL